MVNSQLGTKRTCTTCGARFYDLNKSPIICPKCGAENDKDAGKLKRGKGSKSDASKKAVAVKASPIDDEDDIDDTLLGDDDGDDGDLMEDTSDLGEDDDDMAEVMDHLEAGDDDDN